jgi:di/tripeptidase
MIELKEVLEIPTFSSKEDLMIEFISKFCNEHNLPFFVDNKRNIYVTKGEIKGGEFYPCVVAHTDTVHFDQEHLILSNSKITINSENISDGKTQLTGWDPVRQCVTGIGGDDKCGVYICLKMLLEIDTLKAAFFVEEETGMWGSKEADPEFFSNVGYAIQFDAPTMNWFSRTLLNTKLWNESFFSEVKPILENHQIDNISEDPFTDVLQLRKKFDFCVAVFPTGYYNQHSKHEYVIPEETEQCVQMGIEAVKKLGNIKYLF